jgi:hypothetical protein
LLFASGAAYLWRSGLSPKNGEPKSHLDRGLRIFEQRFLAAVYNNRADTPCAVSISTAFLSNEANVSAPSHLPS